MDTNKRFYECPSVDILEVRVEPLCISGNGTEGVGTQGSTFTDSDFE